MQNFLEKFIHLVGTALCFVNDAVDVFLQPCIIFMLLSISFWYLLLEVLPFHLGMVLPTVDWDEDFFWLTPLMIFRVEFELHECNCWLPIPGVENESDDVLVFILATLRDDKLSHCITSFVCIVITNLGTQFLLLLVEHLGEYVLVLCFDGKCLIWVHYCVCFFVEYNFNALLILWGNVQVLILMR